MSLRLFREQSASLYNAFSSFRDSTIYTCSRFLLRSIQSLRLHLETRGIGRRVFVSSHTVSQSALLSDHKHVKAPYSRSEWVPMLPSRSSAFIVLVWTCKKHIFLKSFCSLSHKTDPSAHWLLLQKPAVDHLCARGRPTGPYLLPWRAAWRRPPPSPRSCPPRPRWRRSSSPWPWRCPPWPGPGNCPEAPPERRSRTAGRRSAPERWTRSWSEGSGGREWRKRTGS